MIKHTVLFVSLLSFAACSKSSNDASALGKAIEGAAAEMSKPVKLEFKKIGKLGLEAEVPSDANVDDNSAGAGYPSATIWASPTTFISGGGEMSDVKPTIEETQARLVKEEKSLVPSKADKTADGWVIEMTGKGMMGDALIAVSVRRTIDGKPFDCGSNVGTPAEAAKVTKLCQSIRKG